MADNKIRVVIDADASDLQRELRKAGIQVNTFGRQVSGQSRGMAAFTAATDKQRETLHQMGRAAVVGGVALAAGAALVVSDIVKTGMAYEQQMSKVDGVVDGTAKQMSMLNRVALKLGAETKFSATEAAEGMYELGSAGFKAGQMTGALKGTLALAAASGIELAMAADIASAAIKGFQLKAGDATHVSDVLAKSANTTALQMGDLQLSMKYIAPIAVTTGQSFEMMIAALGVMGDAGIRGEQAGTTLRAGLLRLVKPTSMVKDGLAELGLQSSELYGPDGLLPLPEIVAKLSKGMDGLSKSQQAAAFSGIFGQEAVSGMLTIIDAGPAKLERLTRGFENSAGASAQAAKVMQDNVAGAWEQVTGSIESLEIAVYQQFEQPVKEALLEVSSALDREGPKIQAAFTAAMALPEFKSGDLGQRIRILGQVAQDEWKRLGLGNDLEKIFADVLDAAIPVMAEGGGKLGLAAAKGLAGGFLEANVWGRLLIGGWLFSKLGGFAAVRAAGLRAGTETAAGMSTGMMAGGGIGQTVKTQMATVLAGGALAGGGFKGYGKAAGGQLLAGLGSALNSPAAKGIGIGLGAMVGLDTAKNMFDKNADGVVERLQQIDDEGTQTLGTLARMVGGGKDGLLGFLNEGGTAVRGDAAHELLQVLEQINGAHLDQIASLRKEAEELMGHLDLTKQQKQAYEDMLNAPAQKAGDVQSGIDKLASGYITRMADITKLARKNASAAADAYGKSTPQWRSAMARNMNATVKAIQAGMHAGVIEVGKGKARIRRLLRQRDLVTGNDVGDIAKGFRRTWVHAGNINRAGINHILKDLGKMPPGARQKAVTMMIQMAQAMEKGSKLSEGSASRLRSAILTQFNIAAKGGVDRVKKLQDAAAEGGRAWSHSLDGMGKDTKSGIDTASSAIDKSTGNMRTAWRRSAADARAYANQVQTAVVSIPPVTGAAYGSLRDQTNTVMAAYDSDKKISYAFRYGGVAPFGGSGLVDGMFSPGEKLVHGNNVAYVPGKPEARDSVHLRVPEGTGVLTWDGQAREAAGESLGSAIRNQAPHFREGGPVGDYLKRPVLSGGASVPRSAGQSGINMAEQAAEKWIENHIATNDGTIHPWKGIDVADWIYGALQFAAKKGVAPQPTSGYRSHAENVAQGRFYHSKHEDTVYPGGAVDFGGYETGYAEAQSVIRATADYKYPLISYISSFDKGHTSGTGHHMGGFVRSLMGLSGMPHFRKGSKGIWAGTSIDKEYPANDGYSGAKLPGYVIKALAEWAGLPGVTMEQITRGESTGHPGMDISDPPGRSRGLYAINDTWHDGSSRMRNPILNTLEAKKIVGSGLPNSNIWHGWKHVTGNNLHYDGDVAAIARHLGGKGGKDGKDSADPHEGKVFIPSGGARADGKPAGQWISKDRADRLQDRADRLRARTKRRRLKKIRARGIPHKMLREDGRLVGRVASLQDNIDQTTTKSRWDTSPGGEEQTDGEVRSIVALLERELGILRKRRRLLKRGVRLPLRNRLKQVEDEIKAATSSRVKHNGKWVKNPAHTNLGALRANRTTVRGAIRDATSNLREVAGYNEKGGGEILRVESEIRGYGVKASESERDSETADLLREQLRGSQRNLALGESQFGIFKQFLSGAGAPYIGAFAMGTGGKRVGTTGMALLHEDEIVTPSPKGPYGNHLTTPGAQGGANVTLVLQGDAQNLVKVVDARIDGKAAQINQRVDRSLGRKQRQISVAPGR